MVKTVRFAAVGALLIATGILLGRATYGGEPEEPPSATVKVQRNVMPVLNLDRYSRKELAVELFFPEQGVSCSVILDGTTVRVGPRAERRSKPTWRRWERFVEVVKPREFTVSRKLAEEVLALAELQARVRSETARLGTAVAAAGLLADAGEQAAARWTAKPTDSRKR